MRRLVPWALLLLLMAGCGDENPFGNVRPRVEEGSGRIWEVSARDLPSAFDIVSGRRLFLGSGDIGQSTGDIFLDGPPASAELRLRSVISLLRGEPAHLVQLQDLGAVDFDVLREVPDGGYIASGDATGLAVAQGHVYALRIRSSGLDPTFAKLVVDAIGSTDGDADRQFIDFRYAFQVQPGNRRFEND